MSQLAASSNHNLKSFFQVIKSSMTDEQSIPGTIQLVDIEGIVRAKHAPGDQKDVILIPAPFGDPVDPSNWSAKLKLISTASISVCIYSTAQGSGHETLMASY